MLRELVHKRLSGGKTRTVTFLHSARTTALRPFRREILLLTKATPQSITLLSAIGHPTQQEQPHVDFDYAGRINAQVLRDALPGGDCNVFLCGPPAFMQPMYDHLRQRGVPDVRICAEAFGPSTLRRSVHAASEHPAQNVGPGAIRALVTLRRSRIEAAWTPQNGRLLPFAEKQGARPEFGCRGGSCGHCAVRVVLGSVSYRQAPSAEVPAQQTLLCVARPAPSTTGELARLIVDA